MSSQRGGERLLNFNCGGGTARHPRVVQEMGEAVPWGLACQGSPKPSAAQTRGVMPRSPAPPPTQTSLGSRSSCEPCGPRWLKEGKASQEGGGGEGEGKAEVLQEGR